MTRNITSYDFFFISSNKRKNKQEKNEKERYQWIYFIGCIKSEEKRNSQKLLFGMKSKKEKL
jgi:hypothetical protein